MRYDSCRNIFVYQILLLETLSSVWNIMSVCNCKHDFLISADILLFENHMEIMAISDHVINRGVTHVMCKIMSFCLSFSLFVRYWSKKSWICSIFYQLIRYGQEFSCTIINSYVLVGTYLLSWSWHKKLLHISLIFLSPNETN